MNELVIAYEVPQDGVGQGIFAPVRIARISAAHDKRREEANHHSTLREGFCARRKIVALAKRTRFLSIIPLKTYGRIALLRLANIMITLLMFIRF
jgi:hypothetical protein